MNAACALATMGLGGLATHANAGTLTDFRTVALSGQQAPDPDGGVTFARFSFPVINAVGQTAFVSSLAGDNVISESNNIGLYSEGSGSLAQVARTGDQAPDAPDGVKFFGVSPPVLNKAGQIAFGSNLTGADSPNTIYTGVSSGSLARVAREGEPVPGESGVSFSGGSQNGPALNAAGQIAFTDDLTGDDVNSKNDRGVYIRDSDGSFAKVARAGDQAPNAAGDDAAGDVSFGDRFSDPVLNAAGQTAFKTNLIAPVDTSVSSPDFFKDFANALAESGIYSGDSGSLAQVARFDQQAPDASGDVKFKSFEDPVLNKNGETAFVADLFSGDDVGDSGPDVSDSNDSGIFSGDSDSLAQVARAGDSAPGATGDVKFSSFKDPMLNAAGQTAFSAGLTGDDVTGSDESGIYREDSDSGTLVQVAREGQEAPNADGIGLTGVEFDRMSIIALNEAGQIAFVGDLTGDDVDSDNNRAIYATDRDGKLREIVRKGDFFDDHPLIDDSHRISRLNFVGGSGRQDGGGSVFNDLGQLVFSAEFSNSENKIVGSGVFVSNAVAIPEPLAVALVAVGAPLLLMRRRGDQA